ncbi:MAG: hypothetical protein LBU32_12200 [Clostridiales bacterium]|nr:hypothetical protein [Clostridiales bacterium]
MGLFDKLLGKKNVEPLPTGSAAFIEAARLISGDDREAASKVSYCMEHTKEYLETEGRPNRGLTKDVKGCELCMFAMIDTLIDNGFAVEFDWKEEQDEILHGIRAVAQKLGLAFTPEPDYSFLDDNEDRDELEPERVFTLVALNIRSFHYRLACIDIGSDSYVICFLQHKDYDRCEKMLAGMKARLYSF